MSFVTVSSIIGIQQIGLSSILLYKDYKSLFGKTEAGFFLSHSDLLSYKGL